MTDLVSTTHGEKRDTVEPKPNWEFDQDVTDAFDDMLRRSIPEHDTMRQACTEIAGAFIGEKGSTVVDLGASRGGAVADLIEEYASDRYFVLNEVSEPMADVLRERFAREIRTGNVIVNRGDLRSSFPRYPKTSVILSILTLQFVPTNYRQRIVTNAYDALEPGGAFIACEKVLGRGERIDQVMRTKYHALKYRNGYSYESIDRKAASLEGVLVPVTAAMNETFLRDAGFRYVDCFWRWMNFAAWVAVK